MTNLVHEYSAPYGTLVSLNGNVVSRSKNLRAMRDYARVSPVVRVSGKRDGSNPYNGRLTVEYANGARSHAFFSSYHIMVDWVRNRRSWRGAEITLQENVGYITKPGLIAGGTK